MSRARKVETRGARLGHGRQLAPPPLLQARLLDIRRRAGGQRLAIQPVFQEYRVEGDLDLDALAECFTIIARRHEPLRTRFFWSGSEWLADVKDPDQTRVPVEVIHLRSRSPNDLSAEMMRRIYAPRDPASDDLFAASYFRSPAGNVLLLVADHLVMDGWSFRILIEEARALYRVAGDPKRAKLPELPVTVAGYAQAQREWLKTHGEQVVSFWKAQMDSVGFWPRLPAALRSPGPRTPTSSPPPKSAWVDADLATTFHRRAAASGITQFMAYLTAFLQSLRSLNDRDTRKVGLLTASAGRGWGDVDRLIGCFANTILISIADPEEDFAELSKQARDATVAAILHDEVPFEELIRILYPHEYSQLPYGIEPSIYFHFVNVEMHPHDFDDAWIHPASPSPESTERLRPTDQVDVRFPALMVHVWKPEPPRPVQLTLSSTSPAVSGAAFDGLLEEWRRRINVASRWPDRTT